MSYRLITRQDEFESVIEHAQNHGPVALDTEAASFHRYHDRVYLAQLTAGGETSVIDPLGLESFEPFGRLLADPAVEKVFHDADYDLRLLHHEFGFQPRRLFDTRIAAQLLGEPGIGLGSLLEKYLGLKPDKRFQRADWSARPLTGGMLDYAAGDTSHLLELRGILRTQLVDRQRLAWAEEEFVLIEQTRWEPGEADPRESFIRLKGARDLDRRGLALLRELYDWRETTAARLDRASFRVMGNEVLLHLSAHPVRTIDELARVKSVGPDQAAKRGGEVLAAIERGLEVPDAELPKFERGPRRVPPDPELDARLDRLKARRNQLAEEYGLQPGVLCPNGTLEAIARANPQSVDEMKGVPGLREWQRNELGGDLLAVMAPDPTA
ncbi:MAG TPA: ribonuclease D [Gemmatimonadales bacterium]|nr:ribonuclease D [Gemmatimonadales bacterium]